MRTAGKRDAMSSDKAAAACDLSVVATIIKGGCHIHLETGERVFYAGYASTKDGWRRMGVCCHWCMMHAFAEIAAQNEVARLES